MGSRDIYGGMNYVQGLTEISDSAEMGKLLEKEKKRFAGAEVQGKTLGVVGLGAIGSMIANLALELGMNVVGYDPAISVEAAWQLSSSVQRMDNLEALLARADFITLHVDFGQMGVGGDDSWGAQTHDEYKLFPKPYSLRFLLQPIICGEQ